ncbi:MAG: hypothetical protein NVSMB5_13260 [Candidatus Velthaea sp.]
MNRACLAILAIALFLTFGASASSAQSDALSTQTVDGTPVRIIRVDLADPRVHVSVATAAGFPHGAEPFPTIVARSHATIAVNGAYFSRLTLEPIGDVVVGGSVIYQGLMGTALAITRDNDAAIGRVVWGHAADWSRYETVLSCGPALVLDRKIDVHPAMESFRDPHIMGAATRMGVALTDDRHLLIVNTASAVTFEQWAHIMLTLGAASAMNLDGAGSLAMYYRGKTIVTTTRPLTNLLVVRVDP